MGSRASLRVFFNLVLFSCILAFANTCVDLEDKLVKVMGTLLKRCWVVSSEPQKPRKREVDGETGASGG